MTRDQVFAQAVQLAAAFVANGDIRMGTSTQEGQGLDQLADLVCTLYAKLNRCYDRCTAEDA